MQYDPSITMNKSITFLLNQLLEVLAENDNANMYLFLDPSLASKLQNTAKLMYGFVSIYMKSPTARDIAIKQIHQLYEESQRPSAGQYTITYRKVNASRLQVLVESNNDLAFIWESPCVDTSSMHTFTLNHIMFKESDDDMYYWIPWSTSLSDAETEYSERKLVKHSTSRDYLKYMDTTSFVSTHLKTLDDLSKWVEQCEQQNEQQMEIFSDDDESDDAYWNRYSQVDVY